MIFTPWVISNFLIDLKLFLVPAFERDKSLRHEMHFLGLPSWIYFFAYSFTTASIKIISLIIYYLFCSVLILISKQDPGPYYCPKKLKNAFYLSAIWSWAYTNQMFFLGFLYSTKSYGYLYAARFNLQYNIGIYFGFSTATNGLGSWINKSIITSFLIPTFGYTHLLLFDEHNLGDLILTAIFFSGVVHYFLCIIADHLFLKTGLLLDRKKKILLKFQDPEIEKFDKESLETEEIIVMEQPEKFRLAVQKVYCDLYFFFSGKRIVKNASFGLEKNKIFGIIGENGAGKSTLLKLSSGILRRTYGEIKIDGERMDQKIFGNNLFGICHQDCFLLEDFTLEQNFEFFAQLRGYRESIGILWLDLIKLSNSRKKYP